MRIRHIHSLAFIALLSSLLLGGCLFGDGSENIPITYMGKTTPAEITAENANEIAAAGQSGQQLGGIADGLNSISAAEVGTGGAVEQVSAVPLPVIVFEQMKANIQKIQNLDVPSVSVAGAVTTVSGDCGGSATVDDSGTSFSATYDDFCVFGVTVSGRISVSGDLQTSATISFNQMRFRGFGVDMSMNGTMKFSAGGGDNFSITTNMVFRDNVTGLMTKTENYKFTIGAEGMRISGRIYLSDYGYVDIETLEPITFTATGGTGKIRFTGQNSSVLLEFLPNGKFRVTVENSGRIVYTEEADWEDIFNEL